jgi:hypothetical protein
VPLRALWSGRATSTMSLMHRYTTSTLERLGRRTCVRWTCFIVSCDYNVTTVGPNPHEQDRSLQTPPSQEPSHTNVRSSDALLACDYNVTTVGPNPHEQDRSLQTPPSQEPSHTNGICAQHPSVSSLLLPCCVDL